MHNGCKGRQSKVTCPEEDCVAVFRKALKSLAWDHHDADYAEVNF